MTDRPSAGVDVDPETFKAVFRRHAAGVCIITVDGPDGPAGFTATSLTSVSLQPPLLSFAVAETASTWPALAGAADVVVNLLGADARPLADRFATSGLDRFAAPTRWSRWPSGPPRLDDADGWLHAQVDRRIPVGDHHLVVARVTGGRVVRSGPPLLYHDGAYGRLADLPDIRVPAAS